MIRDALYLAHILACIARIAHYTAEGRAAFLEKRAPDFTRGSKP